MDSKTENGPTAERAAGPLKPSDPQKRLADQADHLFRLDADGNANGVVDAADYVVWRQNLAAQTASAWALGASAVPETATIVMFGIASFLIPQLTRKEKN